MFTAEFDFDLPEHLIAQHPVEPRDSSRLLVLDRQSRRIQHCRFEDLPELLGTRDILALNNTRVIPARLIGHRERTGGKWEGLFLQDLGDGSWEVLSRTRGHLQAGESIIVSESLRLVLTSKSEAGHWVVQPKSEGDPATPTRH